MRNGQTTTLVSVLDEISNLLCEFQEKVTTTTTITFIIMMMSVIYFADHSGRAFFDRSNTGIVGSNPTQGMDVSVCVYSVFVLSYV
jgi:hypothetical protein